MDLLLLVFGLIGLAILAIRFGHDSRETFTSAEQVQAALGLTWDGDPAHESAATQHRTIRHHTALALYRVADWVQPPTNDARRAA